MDIKTENRNVQMKETLLYKRNINATNFNIHYLI